MEVIVIIICLGIIFYSWKYDPALDTIQFGGSTYLIVWYNAGEDPNCEETVYRDYKIIVRLWH